MTEDKPDQEVDFAKIARDATETANNSVPRGELSWRMRAALVLAALIVVVNAVIGVYNSLALRQEVECNHQLQTALYVVGDQNRNITKAAIDSALSGGNLTVQQRLAIQKTYDAQFAINTSKRNQLLKTTCKAGTNAPSS